MANLVSRPGAMLVTGLVTAAIVVVAVILLVQDAGNAPIQVLPPDPQSATAGPATSNLPEDSEVRVYVSGAVRDPGVYTMVSGDRLADAVDAAGGAVDGAQLESVNLALRVVDQGHYHVPSLGETPLPQMNTLTSAEGAETGQADPSGLVSPVQDSPSGWPDRS
ncbi:MAG: hypothetical protein BZY88_06480 [SAR202 cluster bacterium Io17-Chloro-G9]|nr:MAG: hypothetical protein BZY88_06480 [SAR202 cluster bacterium Io17-Chloro-G9]